MLPAITRDTIGTCRPSDLLAAVSLFDAKYEVG